MYVLLWVIADFFLLKEMREKSISDLEIYCEKYMNITMDYGVVLGGIRYEGIVINKLSDGIATAYSKRYSHAKPCQKVLIDFVFANRFKFFPMEEFHKLVEEFRDFGHDILMAVLRGTEGGWAAVSESEYKHFVLDIKCEKCKRGSKKEQKLFINPQAGKGMARIQDVHWSCEACVQIYGYPWMTNKKGQTK